MNINSYTYRVTWSPEDGEHVALCAEFPFLSWLAATPEKALAGIRRLVGEVVAGMQTKGETRVRPTLAELLAATPRNIERVEGWGEMPSAGKEL